MEIFINIYRWITESLLFPFHIFIPNIDTNVDNIIIQKETQIIPLSELITRPPYFGEIITLQIPHLGLGNYALFLNVDNNISSIMITLQLTRVSNNYVIIKIINKLSEREILWDLSDNYIYTEDNSDVNYWDVTYNAIPSPRGIKDFSVRNDEILSF